MVADLGQHCFNHARREKLVHRICCTHRCGDQCVIQPSEATRKQPKHNKIPLKALFVA